MLMLFLLAKFLFRQLELKQNSKQKFEINFRQQVFCQTNVASSIVKVLS